MLNYNTLIYIVMVHFPFIWPFKVEILTSLRIPFTSLIHDYSWCAGSDKAVQKVSRNTLRVVCNHQQHSPSWLEVLKPLVKTVLQSPSLKCPLPCLHLVSPHHHRRFHGHSCIFSSKKDKATFESSTKKMRVTQIIWEIAQS